MKTIWSREMEMRETIEKEESTVDKGPDERGKSSTGSLSGQLNDGPELNLLILTPDIDLST